MTTAQEATARHVRDALRALGYGHGIHWAADITTLPLRFVVSVARAHGMTDAAGDEYDGWTVTGTGRRLDGGEVLRLPGRCGECGYLETAPGHQVTCGRDSGRAVIQAAPAGADPETVQVRDVRAAAGSL
jgi:hypothetical protein